MSDELTPFERLIEGTTQLAMMLHAYHDALRENGFSEDDAMFLCTEYQKGIIAAAAENNRKNSEGQ